jgi:ribosomal protein S18 acetylase RimI-like enzyme
VAAELMRSCLAEARREGGDLIWLAVWKENPRAIAFYRKWGFDTAGEKIFQLGSDPQTDLVMIRMVGE